MSMSVANNKRSQMTKLLLKTSLMELMEEKPIRNITIKAICDGAELNRSTFYLHYADQYSLLEDVEKDVIANTFKSLEEEDSISDSEFNIYMDTLFDYLKDNKNFVKVLFNNPDAHAFKDLFIDTAMAKIKETEESCLPKNYGKYIYAYAAQGCYNLVKEWINADFDIPSNEISKLILQLYQSSIRIENI